MRTRTLSSLAVILVGLVPVLIGGPVFALLMLGLGVAAYREYLVLGGHVAGMELAPYAGAGATVVALFAIPALLGADQGMLFAVSCGAVVVPLLLLMRGAPRMLGNGLTAWALMAAGTLYLGLPIYAATALRAMPGQLDSTWLTQTAERLAIAWDPALRGLAWTVLVVLSTWIGDTAAYLVGSRIGRRKLVPHLSPNKTVEGALGGLIGATAVAAIAWAGLGLGAWWQGAIVGVILGIVGQLGDLAESFLKRQAGVKDSGTLVPGHGGVLDRIDALLFAFPAGYLLAILLDGGYR